VLASEAEGHPSASIRCWEDLGDGPVLDEGADLHTEVACLTVDAGREGQEIEGQAGRHDVKPALNQMLKTWSGS
jgi:hypothetical protein